MSLSILRLVTIMLAALTMSMAVAHALEMPVKLKLSAEQWTLAQNLYPMFGFIGGVVEVGAVLTSAFLAFRVRRGRVVFAFTLAGALLLAAALVTWIALVEPMNKEQRAWGIDPRTTLDTNQYRIPSDWSHVRRQWEYAHAARAVLQVLALGALVWSVTLEIPRDRPRPNRL